MTRIARLLVVAVAVAGCSSPPSITLPGLSGRVTVATDAQGIPHLTCQTDGDCVRVEGYLHARDRFFQMDVLRRAGRGRLASLMGPSALDADVGMRLVQSDDRGEPMEEQDWAALQGTDSGDLLEAYAEGVNAWLEEARADPEGAGWSAEYDALGVTPSEVPDWEPEDTLAVRRQLFYRLSDPTPLEIQMGAAWAALPPAVAADLLDPKPATSSAVLPASETARSGLAPDGRGLDARRIAARLAPARRVLAEAGRRLDAMRAASPRFGSSGSNAWAIAPALTTAGNAILAYDPHLPLTNPSPFYLVQIDDRSKAQGTLRVAGATVPGYPGWNVGYTPNLAVGTTTAHYDLGDAYVETLSPSGNGVMIDGEEVPFVEVEHSFDVAGADPESRTLRFVPGHGPVVAIDEGEGKAVTIRWVGDQMTAAFSLSPLRAGSLSAYRDAAPGGFSDQCGVVADREGHVGLVAPASVPHRPWASATLPPWLPLPGDGSAEWDGYLPDDEIPSLTDPPAGFVATANNELTHQAFDWDATNPDYTYLQSYVVAGYRHQRIVSQIRAGGDAHDVASEEELQADVWVGIAPDLLPHILDIAANADLTRAGAAVVQAVQGWQLTCPTGLRGHDPNGSIDPDTIRESAGCAAFHVAALAVFGLAVADDFQAAGVPLPANLDTIISGVVRDFDAPESSPGGGAFWDDATTPGVTETREQIVAKGLDQAGLYLALNLGSDPGEWAWGRIHTLTLQSPLSIYGISGYDDGPWANDGGNYTVDAAYTSATGMAQTRGPVMRMVVEMDPKGPHGRFALPGGERDGDDDLMPAYLDNSYFDMPFTPREVRQQTVDVVRFTPP